METRCLEGMAKKVNNLHLDFIGDMEETRAYKLSGSYFGVLDQVRLKAKNVLHCARPQRYIQKAIACGMKTVRLGRGQERPDGVRLDYEVTDLHGATVLRKRAPLNHRWKLPKSSSGRR